MMPQARLLIRFAVIVNPNAPKDIAEAAINETISRLLDGRGISDADIGYVLAEHDEGCPAPDGGLEGCGCTELTFEIWGTRLGDRGGRVSAIDPKSAN